MHTSSAFRPVSVGIFMALLPMHLYFGNNAEEFHPHETLFTPMKLLSSLSSSIRCHVNIFNAHETLIKSTETDVRIRWREK
jgi:hypothetical protein